MTPRYLRALPSAASLVAGAILFAPHLRLPSPGGATQLHATLSEWKSSCPGKRSPLAR